MMAEAMRLINRRGLPDAKVLLEHKDFVREALTRPNIINGLRELLHRGVQQRSDVEYRRAAASPPSRNQV